MRSLEGLKKTQMYVFLTIVALFTAGPFILVLNTSLRTTKEVIKNGPLALPSAWAWNNYVHIWKVGNFSTYFKNSVIVTLIVVVVSLVISIMAAYAFAYLKFIGKEMLFLLIVLGLIIPIELIIIPLFFNLKSISLLNTRWAIIMPQIALSVPFTVFLFRGFMKDISASLLESARMDGSTEFKNLIYIIMPLMTPVVVAAAIFAVLGTWNNFMLPTILIRNQDLLTLPVGLNYFRTKFTMDYSMVATSAIISAIPTILTYILFQRKIITGLTMGALKE
ncbi:carbohydrate ABC transporter permease [Cohnella silvisoli]|uniref:Carbohydrate ABC transporter permease n=1 Tax=Cohnella silvisoli TaxID=2873699 RepID=A0ABV1KSQ6_9BACL|nr:carbohydrate ABC transporter permease [Cohnella silvisoli]MCD9021729.1 carbohydrate ABC transporter permease [Cohnella silvisoli]